MGAGLGAFGPQTVQFIAYGQTFSKVMAEGDVWTVTGSFNTTYHGVQTITWQIAGLSTLNVMVVSASGQSDASGLTCQVLIVQSPWYWTNVTPHNLVNATPVIDGSMDAINPTINYPLNPQPTTSVGANWSQPASGGAAFGVYWGVFTLTADVYAFNSTVPATELSVDENSSGNVITPIFTIQPSANAPVSTMDVTRFGLMLPSPGPTHGTMTVSGESYLYTPSTGFVGTDSFTPALAMPLSGEWVTVSTNVSVRIPIPTYPPTSEVMLSWSDDGGHNFANRQVQDMGEIGQTAQRVIFRRIGSTRRNSGLDRVFELSSEAPMQVCLVGASLNEN